MKKISILALQLGYGGVEKVITTFANMLCDTYDIEIISAYKMYDKPAFHIDDRVKIKYLMPELKPNREEFISAVKSINILKILIEGLKSIKILYLRTYLMKKEIKKIKSGIIVSTRILYTKLLEKYSNKNVLKVAQEHRWHNNNNRYIRDIYKACKNLDYLIPASEDLTKFYKNIFSNSKVKCIYIPWSLDDIPNNESTLKEKNIISVGRLSKEKGFLDLIDVFELVHNKCPDWKLNIVGDGAEKSKLIDRIESKNLESFIILHGYRSKEYINNQLLNSSIYVMPSFEESFGLVVLEAFSYSIPIVTFSSAKGVCEIIGNSNSGFIVTNRDKQEMANKIINLIINESLRKEMGKTALNIAMRYTKESVKHQWIEIFES